jgi:hypothetical protein
MLDILNYKVDWYWGLPIWCVICIYLVAGIFWVGFGTYTTKIYRDNSSVFIFSIILWPLCAIFDILFDLVMGIVCEIDDRRDTSEKGIH